MQHQYQPHTKIQRGALSSLELANRWGKSRQHIYNMIAQGQIQSFKSGRSHLISMSEIERIEGGEQAANDGINGCRR